MYKLPNFSSDSDCSDLPCCIARAIVLAVAVGPRICNGEIQYLNEVRSSPNFILSIFSIPFLAGVNRVENNVGPDQLASLKPADLDLHSLLKMILYCLLW